jgi:cytochrome d ubiquinol oxidase subunit I
MFGLDAFHLARIQFAFTVSFHYLSRHYHRPGQLSGGTGRVVAEDKNPVWRSLYHFWSKIFAVNFGMGVVSGLVMAYQFGTNWSGFSEFAGSITGPLLTYEVLTAFFLEAGSSGSCSLAGTASARHALFRHLHGRAGDHHLDLLDPRLQQLDADAAGVRNR